MTTGEIPEDMVLKRKQYLVGITIIEARCIVGLDMQGTSDPFIKVRCAGREQQSSKKYEVNSATWLQSLTFEGIMMNQFELETFEMVIELYDHNAILANELIGQYTVGLSTLYRHTNHEFYKVWVGLFRKDDPNKVQAYLQISCFIIGPNERPPVHSQDENFGDDDFGDDSEEDEEEIAKRIENIKRAQGVIQIVKPSTIDKAFQLTITVDKAEQLPKPEGGGSIRPFVSARVFGANLITSVKANNKPKWFAKLQFPIYYPILNDKITMRLWFWSRGLLSNTFVANIPEQPSESDSFNLSKLFASEGRMPVRWINLYGVRPENRSSRTKGLREGTEYLGRVLLAFSLISNERPQLNASSGNQMKEPKTRHYQLWVDLYQLIKCEILDEGAPMWAKVSIGIEQQKGEQVAKADSNGKQYFWKWKQAQRQVPELIELQFPVDLSQVPDIFINFYTNTTFSSNVRFAYLRLRARDCLCSKPKPQWFRLTSPYNDTGDKNIGMVLANVQFLRWEPGVTYNRFSIEKAGRQEYRFYCQILQGFEIASCKKPDELKTKVEVQIGQIGGGSKKGTIQTSQKVGRYPVWNYLKSTEVKLQKQLAFEADMRVSLYNESKSLFRSIENNVIGEFAVPVISMMTKSDKPQFFNLLNEEGQFMGQILCNFYLEEYVPDLKAIRVAKKKGEKYVDPRHQSIMEKFESTLNPGWEVDIEFSLFGIRNLVLKSELPVVTISLTDKYPNEERKKTIHVNQEWKKQLDLVETSNPNFGEIVKFEKVKLVQEPLCWPYIEILVSDQVKEENMFGIGGCEECFTTVSLVTFAKEIVGVGHDLLYAEAQLHRNQDCLMMVQNQIDSTSFLKKIGAVIDELDMNNLITNADTGAADQEMPANANAMQGRGSLRNTVMDNGLAMKVLNEGTPGAQNESNRKQGSVNIFRDINRMHTLDGDADISQLLLGAGAKGAAGDNQGFDFGVLDEEDEDMELVPADQAGQGPTNDLERGVVVYTDQIDEIPVTKKDKDREKKVRNETMSKLQAEHTALMRKLKQQPVNEIEKKDKIKIRMMELTDSIEELRNEEMNEIKFWGMLALEDDSTGFDYGREILKDATYETILELPFDQLPLFTENEWTRSVIQSPVVQVEGILRSGKLSGASIKAKIKLTDVDKEESDEDVVNGPTLMPQQNQQKDAKKKAAGGNNTNKWEKVNDFCKEIAEEFKYDIFKEKYLNKLTTDYESYRVRVYLISAQNLTATGSKLDVKSRMAGMTAMCVANPYPVLTLGDGRNNDEKKIVKKVVEREDSINEELNPQFWRWYELDAIFPEDWRLEIAIYDKGVIGYADSMIGATVIDIENRLHSNPYMLNMRSLRLEFDQNKRDRNQKKLKPAEKQKYKHRYTQITNAMKKMKEVEQYLVPVEYRELTHPSKTQAQGIVETWVEVLTLEQSRNIQQQKLKTFSKETYEIRFIVWETRYVPLVDGDKVDIYVKVIWDPTGDPDDYIEKQTDTHYFSKTGWGLFNWRFKFDLKIPCDFPRLKVLIFDAGLVVDEVIGEGTLNLKKTIDKLEKEGSIAIPKTYIQCFNPNKQGEEGGCLMFSMDILLKEDADGDPVGESWDEPNQNPFLKKPTVGRGVASVFGEGGFNWNFDFDWNPFGKFLPFLLYLMYFLSVITFIMYYRMFNK